METKPTLRDRMNFLLLWGIIIVGRVMWFLMKSIYALATPFQAVHEWLVKQGNAIFESENAQGQRNDMKDPFPVDTEIFLHNVIANATKEFGRLPDCFIIWRTKPPLGEVFGPPLAIFKTTEALHRKFVKICQDADKHSGISIQGWTFDD